MALHKPCYKTEMSYFPFSMVFPGIHGHFFPIRRHLPVSFFYEFPSFRPFCARLPVVVRCGFSLSATPLPLDLSEDVSLLPSFETLAVTTSARAGCP